MEVLKVLSKLVCSCTSKNKGDDSRIYLPPSFPKLKGMDEKWATRTLRHSGYLGEDNRVTNVSVEPFGGKDGFFSELACVRYEYADADQAALSQAPTVAIAKFLPRDFQARLTLALFNLGKAEVYAYIDVIEAGTMPLRTPRCYFGDFCSGTTDVSLVLEQLDSSSLGDQASGGTLAQAKQMMIALAKMHAHYWGCSYHEHELRRIPSIYNENYALAKSTLKTRMFIEKCNSHGCPVEESIETFLMEDLKPLLVPALKWFDGSPFRTLCHGDPRLDNWYFDSETGEGGVFDWQQVHKGPCYGDVCWALVGSFRGSFYSQYSATLIELYWTELQQRLGGKLDLEFEDFMQGYAMYLGFALVKQVISVPTLGKSRDVEFLRLWEGTSEKVGLLYDYSASIMSEISRLEAIKDFLRLRKGTLSHRVPKHISSERRVSLMQPIAVDIHSDGVSRVPSFKDIGKGISAPKVSPMPSHNEDEDGNQITK